MNTSSCTENHSTTKTADALKATIYTHLDVDGLVAGALLALRVAGGLDGVKVIFTSPRELPDLSVPDGSEDAYIVDIAPDRARPEAALEFVKRLGSRGRVCVLDHHHGWSAEKLEAIGVKAIIDSAALACAELIPKPDGCDIERWDGFVADARAIDSRHPTLTPSQRGVELEHALKARPSDPTVKDVLLRYVAGDETLRPLVQLEAQRFQRVLAKTDEVAKGWAPCGPAAILDIRPVRDRIDVSALTRAGAKIAPVQCLLISGKAGKDRLIVTSDRSVDLVKTLGINSGCPGRVTLPTTHLTEVVSRLCAVA